ncbi:hypothetical protein SADUNF_Sadunf01G0176700 [Salix dunnii]|uniref:Uncharacterized protein n=1 Tax=Salix dunnii TaxID=1413687 RepID=A0A835TL76_9ROSI|nr:hypothetical protein SADUNF_Sadunf01G0176700 [Salix dunnii]
MSRTGRSWSFRCSRRRNNSHPKPVFSSDWIKYVKKKFLKEGDKKDGEDRRQFGVQALKKSRLPDKHLYLSESDKNCCL